jgi:hypothetical protein
MNKFALHVAKPAEDTTFDGCNIESAKIEGKRTKMVNTTIGSFKKEYPAIWYILLTALILPFVVSIVSLIIDHSFFK